MQVDPQEHEDGQPPPGMRFIAPDSLKDDDPKRCEKVGEEMGPRQHMDHTGGNTQRRYKQQGKEMIGPPARLQVNNDPRHCDEQSCQHHHTAEAEDII